MYVKKEHRDRGTRKLNYYLIMISTKVLNVDDNKMSNNSNYHVNNTIYKMKL